MWAISTKSLFFGCFHPFSFSLVILKKFMSQNLEDTAVDFFAKFPLLHSFVTGKAVSTIFFLADATLDHLLQQQSTHSKEVRLEFARQIEIFALGPEKSLREVPIGIYNNRIRLARIEGNQNKVQSTLVLLNNYLEKIGRAPVQDLAALTNSPFDDESEPAPINPAVVNKSSASSSSPAVHQQQQQKSKPFSQEQFTGYIQDLGQFLSKHNIEKAQRQEEQQQRQIEESRFIPFGPIPSEKLFVNKQQKEFERQQQQQQQQQQVSSPVPANPQTNVNPYSVPESAPRAVTFIDQQPQQQQHQMQQQQQQQQPTNAKDDVRIINAFRNLQNENGLDHKKIVDQLEDAFKQGWLPGFITVIWSPSTNNDSKRYTWRGYISKVKSVFEVSYIISECENAQDFVNQTTALADNASMRFVIPMQDVTYYEIAFAPAATTIRGKSLSKAATTNTRKNRDDDDDDDDFDDSFGEQPKRSASKRSTIKRSRAPQRPSSSDSSSSSSDDDGSSDDSDVDHGFTKKISIAPGGVLARIHKKKWQRHFNKCGATQARFDWAEYKREHLHIAPSDANHIQNGALISNLDFFFEWIFLGQVNGQWNGQFIREQMIEQFQRAELAILTVTKSRQKGVTLDYRGLREETTQASPNDVSNLVDKHLHVTKDKSNHRSASKNKKSSFSFKGLNNNNNNDSNCRKCKEEQKTILFSKCTKHNKYLSGNARAAPQQ